MNLISRNYDRNTTKILSVTNLSKRSLIQAINFPPIEKKSKIKGRKMLFPLTLRKIMTIKRPSHKWDQNSKKIPRKVHLLEVPKPKNTAKAENFPQRKKMTRSLFYWIKSLIRFKKSIKIFLTTKVSKKKVLNRTSI
jgi:hypothetical protein